MYIFSIAILVSCNSNRTHHNSMMVLIDPRVDRRRFDDRSGHRPMQSERVRKVRIDNTQICVRIYVHWQYNRRWLPIICKEYVCWTDRHVVFIHSASGGSFFCTFIYIHWQTADRHRHHLANVCFDIADEQNIKNNAHSRTVIIRTICLSFVIVFNYNENVVYCNIYPESSVSMREWKTLKICVLLITFTRKIISNSEL